METKQAIRQPIVTVCGHVDHGKTSILDAIRGTKIAKGEAGGITQKISFTLLPKEKIIEKSKKVLDKFKIPLEVPGFLFIDTPGHAAFTNLRKRGGSLADIAILVIDINEGLKPQTIETIQILKSNKTPFIIALNKIDNISGWQPGEFFFENYEKQAIRIKQEFDEKMYTIMSALNSHGLNPELYTKISDFTKNIAMIPCSARSGEGISEIIAILTALSQKFLKSQISIKKEARGVVLEVKKDKSINFLESILYDGELKINDEIAIASFEKPVITKVRSIQEALPLNKGFKPSEKVRAASGIRMQISSKEEIMPGMPFQAIRNNLKEVEEEFSKEICDGIQEDDKGIFVKAESLGSLEALLFLLHQKQIKVIHAGIGNITKKDIYFTASLPEEDRILLGFNVDLSSEIDQSEIKDIKVIRNDIVYKIIEDFEKFKEEKQKEIERKKLEELPSIAKITILPYIFRNSSPAIFGIRVDAGVLKQELEVINKNNEKIGRIKTIQEEKTNLHDAGKGKEVAISIPGVNFERQLQKGEVLYTNLSEFQFKKFKENKELLIQEEIKVLQEIAEIKRRADVTWGI
jgi:translation initiation factor 5B